MAFPDSSRKHISLGVLEMTYPIQAKSKITDTVDMWELCFGKNFLNQKLSGNCYIKLELCVAVRERMIEGRGRRKREEKGERERGGERMNEAENEGEREGYWRLNCPVLMR